MIMYKRIGAHCWSLALASGIAGIAFGVMFGGAIMVFMGKTLLWLVYGIWPSG